MKNKEERGEKVRLDIIKTVTTIIELIIAILTLIVVTKTKRGSK